MSKNNEWVKSKASLTSQSCHWFITIRKNVEIKTDLIKQWVSSFCFNDMYAFIEHKGDISVDTGEVEGTHYHILMNSDKRHMKSKMLNSIVAFFGFDNPFGVEVDIYSSFEGCLQYLTHQNHKDKTQHDRSEIITNIDYDTFHSILDTPLVSKVSTSILIGLIEKARSPLDLCKDLGLGVFDHYLKTIRVLWRYIKGNDL